MNQNNTTTTSTYIIYVKNKNCFNRITRSSQIKEFSNPQLAC